MTRRETSVHDEGLSIDIARGVAEQKESHVGDLDRVPAALEGIELPDLVGLPRRARVVEHRLRHARLDEPGADGVDANGISRKLARRRLNEVDDAGLARA